MTLAIYCAGGLGKEIVALARGVSRWDYIIFVDDVTDADWYEGAKVYRFDEVRDLPDKVEFIIANGEPHTREALYQKIKAEGYSMATVLGAGCSLLPSVEISEGCILYDCGVSANVRIGPNVLINTKAIIGHDVVIDAHSVISAFCFLGGFTTIGKCVYMAPGSMAKDRIRIGDDAIISLGAVALRHVKEKSIMIGNPARKLAENTSQKVFGLFTQEG